jgi:hypothetical protein
MLRFFRPFAALSFATLLTVAACGGAVETAHSAGGPPVEDDLPEPAEAGAPDWQKNRFDLRPDAGPDGATEWCGNGVCNPFAGKLGGETCRTCPEDCGACPQGCGDGHCDRQAGETCGTCSEDCGTCAIRCGDGTCNGNESCETCPSDCGKCAPTCGDLKCDASVGETCTNCPGDCGPCKPGCGDGRCMGTENCYSCHEDCGSCLTHCGDGRCDPGDGEDCESCTKDCGNCTTGGRSGGLGAANNVDMGFVSTSNCGDGICNGGETCQSCPGDCFSCATGCGDASCGGTESPFNCPQDCGAPKPGDKLPSGPLLGSCGDGVCGSGETCANCYFDCHGHCTVDHNNKVCEPGENCKDNKGECYRGQDSDYCTPGSTKIGGCSIISGSGPIPMCASFHCDNRCTWVRD